MALRRLRRDHVTILLVLTTLVFYLYFTKFASNLPVKFESDASAQEDTNMQKLDRCKVPELKITSPAAIKAYQKLPPLNCQKKKPLTRVIGTTLSIDPDAVSLYNSPTDGKVECCFSYIYRRKQSIAGNRNTDTEIEYGPCALFETAVNLTSDFVQVECKKDERSVYLNAHAAILPRDKKRGTGSTGPIRSEEMSLRPSVMIIGVDSLSRLNFQRQMPRTYKLLEELGFIQYFQYNKVAYNTFPNLVASLTGRFHEELNCCQGEPAPMDDAPLIFKNFRQKDYVTFYAEDSPQMATFSFYQSAFVEPTDYYYKPFSQAFRKLPMFNNNLCFGFQTEMEPLLDYTYHFMYQHRKRPYFGLSWGVQLTHNIFNEAQYADPVYYNFFEKLRDTHILDNTVIFFVSDHGIRFGDFRQSYEGRIEESLPMFFARFPAGFEKHFSQAVANFRSNAYRLTSNFDFYHTLRSLLDVPKLVHPLVSGIGSSDDQRGQSLFTQISDTRNCGQAGISDDWCTCTNSKPLASNKLEVQQAATELVNYLNSLLKKAQECYKLSLKEVLDAEVKIQEENQLETVHYIVRIKTVPGDAALEATIKYSLESREYSVLGQVSRLNLYGTQSWCVNDPTLKLVCYCKVQNQNYVERYRY